MTGAPVTGAAGDRTGPRPDPHDADLVQGGGGHPVLAVFNRAGVLGAADVHTAVRLGRLAGEAEPSVVLAAALAVRAPRMGHVSVDLRHVRSSVVVVGDEDVDLDALPWPEPDAWLDEVAASPLVALGSAGAGAGGEPGDPAAHGSVVGGRPLRLIGSELYLDRYWRDETEVADAIVARTSGPPVDPGPGVDRVAILERLLPGEEAAEQRRAVELALTRPLAVIAGGPGTGKTTTVARLLIAMFEEAAQAGRRAPLVALAAPTGKAAARMEEAVRAAVAGVDTTGPARRALTGVSGSTIHRLLGSRPDRMSRFRHHAGHRLPHDVVVVDEASMVPLSLMARLLEAVRPDARLVLVGDPGQLVSVEAGAVLADIVGAAAAGPQGGGVGAAAAGPQVGGVGAAAGPVAVLRRNHRFSGPLADLAAAVRTGDAGTALAVLRRPGGGVEWIDVEPDAVAGGSGAGGPAADWVDRTTDWVARIAGAARVGDVAGATAALASHRVLCAHRRGGAGVALWNRRIEEWLASAAPDVAAEGPWYAGRPVMVTVNDYSLRLFNGDTGVTVAVPGPDGSGTAARAVAFDGPSGAARLVGPYRLAEVETVFAMTVHKSQGSEFDHVSVLLPPAASRLLTRELLYTALTRARRGVTVIGSEAALRAAVERPVERASGLGRLLAGRLGPPAGYPA